jgi:DNA-binding GntR family transcriptional regulator
MMAPRPSRRHPGQRSEKPASPDLIADLLRTMILAGELQGGQPLRQDELAARFGVSRIPVREALRILTAEGLVQIFAQRGATVSQLQPDEAEEILEIRYTLEAKAMQLAIPHLDDDLFGTLESLLDEAEGTSSIDRWSEINTLFHERLYAPSARPRLLQLIRSLNANVDRYIRLLVSRSEYRLQAEREHRAILATARVRNISALAALIEQHAVQTAVQLRLFLASAQSGERIGKRRERSSPNRMATATTSSD